jgi:hypothetical protein
MVRGRGGTVGKGRHKEPVAAAVTPVASVKRMPKELYEAELYMLGAYGGQAGRHRLRGP